MDCKILNSMQKPLQLNRNRTETLIVLIINLVIAEEDKGFAGIKFMQFLSDGEIELIFPSQDTQPSSESFIDPSGVECLGEASLKVHLS